ncbi:hypothetical protein BS50DRAFT_664259 [Corynespora cassiicola Philippines]|uniref:Uncharacterized protein n=1 Tax=Corynespora cassiicola Philippines TaxID=1448308 RepID=A0A2T2NVB3_CORCC|nr:hypothetical protein BS50DRAFT_664259 [Corynespora cassiicola Philippines]
MTNYSMRNSNLNETTNIARVGMKSGRAELQIHTTHFQRSYSDFKKNEHHIPPAWGNNLPNFHNPHAQYPRQQTHISNQHSFSHAPPANHGGHNGGHYGGHYVGHHGGYYGNTVNFPSGQHTHNPKFQNHATQEQPQPDIEEPTDVYSDTETKNDPLLLESTSDKNVRKELENHSKSAEEKKEEVDKTEPEWELIENEAISKLIQALAYRMNLITSEGIIRGKIGGSLKIKRKYRHNDCKIHLVYGKGKHDLCEGKGITMLEAANALKRHVEEKFR